MSTRNTKRRWLGVGTGAVALLIVGLGLGVAAAQTNNTATTNAAGSPGSIVCPSVADKLPAIPAQAQAEVTRNLQLLDTQIAEANRRLVTSQGQGGPNFVNNAILGPLKDKRAATIDRIAIAIGRHAARPTGLDGLAGCQLVGAGAGSGAGNAGNAGGGSAPVTATAPAPVVTTAAAPPPAAAGTISCPTVADRLPAIPAQAQAEVAPQPAAARHADRRGQPAPGDQPSARAGRTSSTTRSSGR